MNKMMDILTVNKTAMEDQVRNGNGFIAALDQSGGSTPKALKAYGVEETAYDNDEEMFDLIHGMRTRIVNAPAFTGAKIVGAILFEMTFDRKIGGKPSAQYLWEDRRVVPFLKNALSFPQQTLKGSRTLCDSSLMSVAKSSATALSQCWSQRSRSLSLTRLKPK